LFERRHQQLVGPLNGRVKTEFVDRFFRDHGITDMRNEGRGERAGGRGWQNHAR
jgi:hypothetical protein